MGQEKGKADPHQRSHEPRLEEAAIGIPKPLPYPAMPPLAMILPSISPGDEKAHQQRDEEGQHTPHLVGVKTTLRRSGQPADEPG